MKVVLLAFWAGETGDNKLQQQLSHTNITESTVSATNDYNSSNIIEMEGNKAYDIGRVLVISLCVLLRNKLFCKKDEAMDDHHNLRHIYLTCPFVTFNSD